MVRSRPNRKPDEFAGACSLSIPQPFGGLGRIACGYDGGQIVDE